METPKLIIPNDRLSAGLLERFPVSFLNALCRARGLKPEGPREVHRLLAIMTAEDPFDLVVTLSEKSARVPDPWPEISFLPGRLPGDHSKSRALMADEETGSIRGVPRSGKHERGFTIETKVGISIVSDFPFKGGFVGSLSHSSGLEIAFPDKALGILTYSKAGGFKLILETRNPRQIRDGAEIGGGWVICPRFKAGDKSAFVFHPDTGAAHAVQYEVEKGKELELGYISHWGVVSNGRDALFLPWDSERCGLYDHKTGVLAPVGPRLLLKHGIGRQFSHGDYFPEMDCAVSIGREARETLIFHFKSRQLETVPFPPELVHLLAGAAPCFSQKFGPDGWLYGAPFGSTLLVRFNPRTNEHEWLDLAPRFEGEVALSEAAKGQGWFTEIKQLGNALYFSPGGSDRVMKLEF